MDFSNHVDEMGDNLSLSVGNTIEFGYKIIHNYRMFSSHIDTYRTERWAKRIDLNVGFGS